MDCFTASAITDCLRLSQLLRGITMREDIM